MTTAVTAALRDEICRIGESLHRRGYTVGTAGNISARTDDGWLITPTDACLGSLDPARLAHVAADGRQLSGDRASKTLALHRRIYEASPSTRGVVHTHSTNLVALTLAGVWRSDDVLPPITPYQVMKVGHVPLIAYRRPGDPGAADEAATHAARGIRAVLLERLGPVVWHGTVTQAAQALEELEETAKLWMMLRANPPEPLPEAAIEELRKGFGARW